MLRRALVLALLVGCSPRVAEPETKSVERGAPLTVASSSAPGSAASLPSGVPAHAPSAVPSAGSTSGAAAGSRCIFPTPDVPARPAPPRGPDPRCPADPASPFALRRATVRVAGLDATVDVEVAERDEHRTRGLMFRKELREDQGMLFIFEEERELAFWMRNTCLPLDMLFVASDGVIVGIEENVPTLNDGHYTPGDCPARYVLEVNAGWARRHGVKAGQKLLFGGL